MKVKVERERMGVGVLRERDLLRSEDATLFVLKMQKETTSQENARK